MLRFFFRRRLLLPQPPQMDPGVRRHALSLEARFRILRPLRSLNAVPQMKAGRSGGSAGRAGPVPVGADSWDLAVGGPKAGLDATGSKFEMIKLT